MHTQAGSQKERHVHVGNIVLVCDIWSMVFWYWSVVFEVLTPGIGSKVLVLHGFGPWY